MGAEQKMTMKPFGELTPRVKALEIIDKHIKPIEGTEKIPIGESNGRVLAE